MIGRLDATPNNIHAQIPGTQYVNVICQRDFVDKIFWLKDKEIILDYLSVPGIII